MFESIFGTIIVGVIEAIIFGVIWKKKVPVLRDAAKAVVTAVKTTGASMVATEVKRVTSKNPGLKKALDKIINEAHAYINPEK